MLKASSFSGSCVQLQLLWNLQETFSASLILSTIMDALGREVHCPETAGPLPFLSPSLSHEIKLQGLDYLPHLRSFMSQSSGLPSKPRDHQQGWGKRDSKIGSHQKTEERKAPLLHRLPLCIAKENHSVSY